MVSLVERLPCLREALLASDVLPGPNPFRLLGVAPSAGAEELREAYLARLREHPLESDPEGFEQVKQAWMVLRSPLLKAAATIDWHEAPVLLTEALAREPALRRFVGPDLWLALAREGNGNDE